MNAEADRVDPSSSSSLSAARDRARTAILAAENLESLESFKLSFFGKKGEFTSEMKRLGSLPVEERKVFGAELNRVKAEIESELAERRTELERSALQTRLEKEWIDVTLPVQSPIPTTKSGSIHPITAVQRELEMIFHGMGFTVVDGPEVEYEFYNFDALNMPDSHPARDMQDTIWTTEGHLLRTQCSSMQVRSLELMKPPMRIIVPGRVYRYERVDATHGHTFYQMEGMMIDRNVTVAHLLYFMKTLLREVFGSEQRIRLRPGYFPFVEPGFELDIWFGGRWMELLPCGLVHPRVLEAGGLDPKEWQGFAFGLGLSRLAMTRYDIHDIRHFDNGDLRFLRQFP